MKLSTFLCLICALNPYLGQKLLRKAKFVRGCMHKNRSEEKRLFSQATPNAKSCSKVAEHNRERPTGDAIGTLRKKETRTQKNCFF